MKPWKLLPALFCITLVSSPAMASVPFRGLLYQPTGASVVDVGADGRLQVSNLGSSGQDGVSVDCLHMDGMRLAIDGSCTTADAGASLALTYACRLNGLPPGTPVLSSRVSCSVSAGGYVDISAGVSELSSSPTQTVTLSRDGGAVYSAVVPAGTPARVQMDATGSCPNPTLSCSVDRKVHAIHRGAALSGVRSVTVAGHVEDCDDIDFSSAIDPPDQDCDGVSSELRVSSPPGSSFSVVRCSSGECRVFDHFVQGSGLSRIAVIADVHQHGRLSVSNLGSSGQDGVTIGRGSAVAGITGGAVAARFSPPALSFDPAVDNGASVRVTVTGRSFSSAGLPPSSGSASLALTMTGGDFHVVCDHSGMGAAVESVVVLSHGVEVARAALPPGGSVPVSAPPGGPPAFVVASAGKHTKSGHVTLMKVPMLGAGSAEPANTSLGNNPAFVSNDNSGAMQVSFRCDRILMVGGLQVTGDELVCWGGSCSSGTCSDGFSVTGTDLRVSCPSPASALSSLSLLDFANADGDQVFADVSGAASLSSAHTCVTIPVVFARADTTPVRAYSVRFHLSPELAACGAGVVEGSYLSSVSNTQMFVTDNGGGSYTVDCGILGAACGATGSGTLFSVDLSAVQPPPGDVGVVTVDAVTARDCSNAPVAADPGSAGFIPVQLGAPPPITGLTASPQRLGNPAGAIIGIVVGSALASSSVSVDLYRKGFGNYPLYDNGTSPGHVPAPPATPAAALLSGWKPVTCPSGTCSAGTCSSGACSPGSVLDLPPSRDCFYYVAFARDLYDNVSAVSSMTPGTLDYHLGDVSNGASACSGDNRVDILDMSLLGAHYGASVSAASSFACLDVGPTTDFSVDSRPTTDSVIGFEDFMMFAINYGTVSAPAAASRPAPAPANASRLVVPALPPAGGMFDVGVYAEADGSVQGLSARLAFDPAILEQAGVAPGRLLDQQGRVAQVLSSGPGDVDVALLGAGPGIAGSGEVARVTFRVKAAGDPGLALASLIARDAANLPVAVTGVSSGCCVPAHTSLGFAYPNPFRQSLAFQLNLRSTGAASVGIFDVAGRRVRTLVQGAQSAGTRIVTWDARDDSGLRLAPGTYIVRLETAGVREARTVQLVR